MGIKEKDKSLLEVAIELLEVKKKPQKMLTIVKEVMELKGIKSSAVKELAPQFILDFMQSGYFVYCGDDTWDLKDRQPTSVLDKEGGDYEDIYEDDEDVKNNELKDEIFDEESSKNIIRDNNDDTDDDDDDEDEHEHHHHDGECCCGHHHHHHDHDADEVFTSWGVETAKKFSKADIEHALTELDTGNYGMILRSKGIVDGGADGWLEFDYVPGEWEVRSRSADVGGKLVVIGSKLDEHAITELFGC